MSERPLKIGALFAGYGGLDLAVSSALDAEVAWVADCCKFGEGYGAGHYEPHRSPCNILAHHYPDAPNHGDVSAIDWAQVEPVDIITGGSPCQDLSAAGRRAGMKDGTRSGLWSSMCEAIETIRPRLVVWENVRGALSAEATPGDMECCEFCVGDNGEPPLRALGRVLGDLAEIGYNTAWTGLRAADVGAPHGRWRVFVVAWPIADTRSPGWGQSWLTTAGEAPGGGAPAVHSGRDRAPIALLPTPMAAELGGGPQHPADARAKGQTVRLTSAVLALTGDLQPKLSPVKSPSIEEKARWGDYATAIARWETITGRPAPEPTVRNSAGTAALSPVFVEWMMGLDEGHVTAPEIWEGMSATAARNAQLKALGNGVVPQQAAWAIRHLLNVRDEVAGGA